MTKDLDDLTVGVDPEATPANMTADEFEAMHNRLPLVVSLPPEPPVFTPAQKTRVEALRVSRDIVLSKGSSLFGSSKVDVGISDLVDLAVFITDGTHPLARYEGQPVTVEEEDA